MVAACRLGLEWRHAGRRGGGRRLDLRVMRVTGGCLCRMAEVAAQWGGSDTMAIYLARIGGVQRMKMESTTSRRSMHVFTVTCM
jgi:hypothetical protein